MIVSDRKVIDAMLKPRRFAVVGASAREGSLGNTIMKKVVGFGFSGNVYPINPKTPEILGIKAYKSVREVPDEIDTAVICVPGEFVIDVVKELHAKGVRSCIIISAGFKEIGPVGEERENELKRISTDLGIRVLGPNCFGIINGSSEISLDCTFARNLAPRGHIGFVSQSGAVGAAVNEDLRLTTMGISLFISLGNRIDFDENEALEYLAEDENTRIIFMYLENFANPLRFLEVASRITPSKPVIALKAGKGSHGAQAVASHTGSLAQSDDMVTALLQKTGVIRVDSVPEMIMVAKAFYGGIIPNKEDLAVITNAGGFGVLAIDKAEELGLRLAKFSPVTTEFLESNLPEEASCHNPIDLLGTATDEHYGAALEGVLRDPNVGGVVYNFGPPVMQKAVPIAQKAVDMARKYPDKPILSIYMNRRRILEPLLEAKDVYVSQFDYPEHAVEAYSKLIEYRRIKNRKKGIIPELKVDKDRVSNILEKVQQEKRKFLNFDEAESVLIAYGIPMAKSVLVKPGDDLGKKTDALNFPVALKPAWGGVIHKTELEAVRLNLKTIVEVAASIEEISHRISQNTGEPYNRGFIVQEMSPGNKELILGAVKQEENLHLIMFGLGGIFVELFKDVSFQIPPITDVEAETMIKRVKSYPLFSGFRGEKAIAVQDVIDAILRLAQLVIDFPQIKELDINPFIASVEPGKSMAVDIRIII